MIEYPVPWDSSETLKAALRTCHDADGAIFVHTSATWVSTHSFILVIRYCVLELYNLRCCGENPVFYHASAISEALKTKICHEWKTSRETENFFLPLLSSSKYDFPKAWEDNMNCAVRNILEIFIGKSYGISKSCRGYW